MFVALGPMPCSSKAYPSRTSDGLVSQKDATIDSSTCTPNKYPCFPPPSISFLFVCGRVSNRDLRLVLLLKFQLVDRGFRFHARDTVPIGVPLIPLATFLIFGLSQSRMTGCKQYIGILGPSEIRKDGLKSQIKIHCQVRQLAHSRQPIRSFNRAKKSFSITTTSSQQQRAVDMRYKLATPI